MNLIFLLLGFILLVFFLFGKKGQQKDIKKNKDKEILNKFINEQAKKRNVTPEPEKIEFSYILILPSRNESVSDSESEDYLNRHKSKKPDTIISENQLFTFCENGLDYKVKLTLEEYDRGDHYLPSSQVVIPMNLKEEVIFMMNLNQNRPIQEARKVTFPLIIKEIASGNPDFDKQFSIFYQVATNHDLFDTNLQKSFLGFQNRLENLICINVMACVERNSDMVVTKEVEMAAKEVYGKNITRYDIPHNFIAKRKRGGGVEKVSIAFEYSKNADLLNENNFEGSIQIVNLFAKRLKELHLWGG